ncbi:polysaccharide pyruvyl transferase family protein [Chloroflexota bacterium]
MDKHPVIVYAGGFWATNIGNAFYNLGLLHILQKSNPQADIHLLSDQSGWFWQEGGKNPSNDLNYLQYIRPDFLVLAGPLINRQFINIWEPTLKILFNKGVKLALLSVGCMQYDDDEKKVMGEFFSRYPPHILISRDQYTYDNYKQFAIQAYSGICAAFFMPDAYKPVKTDLENYLVFNFDSITEPEFSIVSSQNNISNSLELNGIQLQTKRKGKLNLGSRNYPTTLNGYKIVRTVHSCIPLFSLARTKLLFKKKNTFVSDIPFGYLNLYANTQGTFSDRVHACVATLAYGNPAMLFSESPRSHLFDRLNLDEIRDRPVILSKDKLDIEKEKEIDFLRTAFTQWRMMKDGKT